MWRKKSVRSDSKVSFVDGECDEALLDDISIQLGVLSKKSRFMKQCGGVESRDFLNGFFLWLFGLFSASDTFISL